MFVFKCNTCKKYFKCTHHCDNRSCNCNHCYRMLAVKCGFTANENLNKKCKVKKSSLEELIAYKL
jgi:hypothetical protein